MFFLLSISILRLDIDIACLIESICDMEATIKLNNSAILQTLGQRLAQRRITMGLTQNALSQKTGVSKRTIENVEAGASTHLLNFIRILRELGMLDAMMAALPEPSVSPVLLHRLQGKVRKRASKKQRLGIEEPTWNWSDEK